MRLLLVAACFAGLVVVAWFSDFVAESYAASSQSLAGGDMSDPAWTREICIRKGMTADALYRLARKEGLTTEEIFALPMEPGISMQQMHEMANMEYRARRWEGTWRGFVDTIYKECMQ